jgi:hypothetical protein
MPTPDTGIDANLNGAIPFDAESQWNIPVDNAPILWDSAQIMASITTDVGLHPDFGSGTYNGITIGIPYVVVPADQPLVPFINNLYTTESAPGPFPIPANPAIEGEGATAYNDAHLIVLQLDANGNLAEEYDFFQISQNADGVWQGYSIAFNLTLGDDQLPMGWTSANAAGLPEFPGLITYDEVQQAIAAGGVNGHLDHALVFTLAAWDIGNALFGAAEHATNGGGAAAFGMRFVLNPDYVIDPSLPIEDIVILNTLKMYGMILADNGANFFLGGVPDPRWNNTDLARLQAAVSGSDFEIVDTTGLVPPPAITVGSGADSLVLQVSESSYDGNAQFTVSVDGAQVWGVQTIEALNSSNQTQTFTFRGNWGTTQHIISINFVNPLSDANGSRDMLLQSVTYDGAATSADPATLSATDATTFKIGTVPTVGSGADTLVLHLCENAYQGDAQFTVSVDGVQIGGVQTVTMQANSIENEDFAILGNWGSGRQTVTVGFINGYSDAGGSRNLYIWGMNYDGTEYSNNVVNLYGGGAGSFLVGTASSIGAGQDTLVLLVSEAAYQGDAQFTVSVDGVQVGGVETAALNSSGSAEAFTFLGNWSGGGHTVTVNFINGLSDAGGSRDLFVSGMSYDGTTFGNNVMNLYGGGSASFAVAGRDSVGYGADTLVLHICEAAYQGDAEFTVSVDGVQVGGVLTAAPSGQTRDFDVLGNWGGGQHTVTVNFVNGLNDAGGSRDLFVWGMSYDGTSYADNVQNLYGGGVGSFLIGTAAPIGSGPDSLVLNISEAAYQGDAQFTVDVDGVQVGGIETATLLASSGNTEAFTFLGNWGSAQNTVTVNFINGYSDAGGSRNLFIRGMSYEGTSYSNNVQNLYGGGVGSFLIGTAAPIGSGPDTLVLNLSEAAYEGDAEFTVSVDGVQVGGIETATLLGSSGKTEAFTFQGDWGSGLNAVTVDFINGLSDAGGSRNLFIEGISYDGTGYANNSQNLYGGGIGSFLVGTAAPIGSGSDMLVLDLSEAAYQGDAEFTVDVDGVQVGGIETVTLLQSSGKSEAFTFLGNWGAGQHTVAVNFINGLSDADGSRNLFISGMSYDGTSSPAKVSNLYGGGSASFTVSGGNTVGSGADTLVLHICEQAYQGDAEFTVSVNGKQVGGLLTATALASKGQTENFNVLGNWGSGRQTVTVNFVNGLSDSGGSRDLFVWGMSYDGTSYGNNVQNLYGGGAGTFLVGTAAPIGTGSDTLVVNLSETAYQGDAQFTVSVDGVQVGGVETATMPSSSGSEPFTFQGNWGAGQHDVTVTFVNGLSDAGGSRNLFVQGMTYNGTKYASNEENLYGGGSGSFTVGSDTIAVSSASLATTVGSSQMTFIAPVAAGQSLVGSATFGDEFQAASANLNGDTISYFGGNDVIDLTDMGFAGVSGTYSGTDTGGTLTVSNGSHNAAMSLLDGSGYSPNAFTLVNDGHGGTAVLFG